MSAIAKEVAEKEVNAWLDYKKIKPKQRTASAPMIEELVEAVMEGIISIDEKNVIKHKLSYPVDGLYSELTYKPRLTVGESLQSSVSIGSAFDSMILSTISALTGKGTIELQKMDTEDYKISKSIAVFFM